MPKSNSEVYSEEEVKMLISRGNQIIRKYKIVEELNKMNIRGEEQTPPIC